VSLLHQAFLCQVTFLKISLDSPTRNILGNFEKHCHKKKCDMCEKIISWLTVKKHEDEEDSNGS